MLTHTQPLTTQPLPEETTLSDHRTKLSESQQVSQIPATNSRQGESTPRQEDLGHTTAETNTQTTDKPTQVRQPASEMSHRKDTPFNKSTVTPRSPPGRQDKQGSSSSTPGSARKTDDKELEGLKKTKTATGETGARTPEPMQEDDDQEQPPLQEEIIEPEGRQTRTVISEVKKPDGPTDPQQEEFLSLLTRITSLYETFDKKMVKVHDTIAPNAANDVKETIKQLEEAGGQIGQLLNELIIRTNEVQFGKAIGIEAETQTGKKTKEAIAAEIQQEIEKDLSVDEMETLIQQYWPETTFRKTKVTDENFQKPRGVRMMIIRDDPEVDDRFLTTMEYQYPRLSKFRRNNTGKQAIMICKTEAMSGTDNKNILIVGKMSPDPTTKEIIRLLTTMDATRRSKTTAADNNDEPPMINFPSDYDGITARKITEITTTAEIIEINKKLTKNEALLAAKIKRTEENEKKQLIIIQNPEGQTLANTMRKLTQNIDTKEIGVRVENTLRPQRGEIRVLIRENTEGAKEKFIEAVEKETNILPTAKPVQSLTKMILKDLDESIDETDIKNALEKIIGNPTAKYIQVEPPRTSEKGSTTAIYYVDRSDVQELLKRSRIQIGWLRCRTEKHIIIPCCQNCQRIGHTAQYCELPYSRERLCHKCAAMGHTVSECTSEIKACYHCEANGHAANSMVCPYYRNFFYSYRKWLREKNRRTGTKGRNTERNGMDANPNREQPQNSRA